MTAFIAYLKTGGCLMIPIIIVAFLLWQRYFASMAALKSGCPAELVAHELRFMAALVAAAPLLGLLGTVIGMIDTFTPPPCNPSPRIHPRSQTASARLSSPPRRASPPPFQAPSPWPISATV
ncbi:MAG: MotA/TolQ/ExbB proton channel family protein [Victivallales bacterium]|nr:MotA/TolQ/ExbB proton channel family protein [Victivallales bacterium]